MKQLKIEESNLLRAYINAVDEIVHKYVPNTVSGAVSYSQLIKYANLRAKVIVQLLGPIQEKKGKYRQIDLEEAITAEKGGK